MASTVVLVIGSNRGIGLGLVEKYLGRPNTIVIATVRNPSKASSKSLLSLPTAGGSKIIVVKIDNENTDDPAKAVETLKTQHGIKHLDLVIANAAIAVFYGPTLDTPVEGFKEHLAVNTVAVLALFQATWSLLQAAPNPKFVPIGTVISSIEDLENWPGNAVGYGASKAALNWLTRNIHREHQDLIAFPIHPGYVQTDMGHSTSEAIGIPAPTVTVKDSVEGVVSKIDGATREKTSGTFASWNGSFINW